MRLLNVFVSLASLILFIGCDQQAGRQVPTGNASSSSADKTAQLKLNLAELLAANTEMQKVDIDLEWDAYFKERKKYKGFPLLQLLGPVLSEHTFEKENTIIIFDCSDGYSPSLELGKLFGDVEGFVVDGSWPDSLDHKFRPYYLVWKGPRKEVEKFPWPYGLSGLQLMSTNDIYQEIKPNEDTSKMTGFRLFQDNCLKCHSINKVGGSVGPELNVPKNITEYWQEKDIIAFIGNPAGYRYNSTMPPVRGLSDKELNEIISYLKYMMNHKIAVK